MYNKVYILIYCVLDLAAESADDTDAVVNINISMNSTMESFSENAWDNYQVS